MTRPLLYIAGPITAPTPEAVEANVDRAVAAGYLAWQKGYAPFIPHLNTRAHEWADRVGRTFTYESYMEWDKCFLEVCDALLFLGPSPGANQERAWADELDIPVYDAVDNLPQAEEFWNDTDISF